MYKNRSYSGYFSDLQPRMSLVSDQIIGNICLASVSHLFLHHYRLIFWKNVKLIVWKKTWQLLDILANNEKGVMNKVGWENYFLLQIYVISAINEIRINKYVKITILQLLSPSLNTLLSYITHERLIKE